MRIRFIIIAALFAHSTFAQISKGGVPPSRSPIFSSSLPPQKNLSSVVLPQPDMVKVRAEDNAQTEQVRFAVPIQTDISLENGAGVWATLPDSSRLWRCAINSPGALAMILLFDDFELPDGASLYAYDTAGKRTLGAYTKESCLPSGKFTIGPLPSDAVVVELHLEKGIEVPTRFHLSRVDYAYHRGVLIEGDPWAAANFGQSLACNVNVNCPEGSNWQSEKKGVARILMVFSNGSAWCSGSLVANTSGTGVPYFLSAHHCQILLSAPQFDQWIFYFDYESAGCTNPTTEPPLRTVLGCERVAFSAATDMLLLKINPIPQNYNVYFNGWSKSATAATNATFVHHPQGDIKKISLDNQAAISHPQTINWGGIFGVSQANTHWKLVPDIGIFEPGSSGCPMFDQNKRIVGQLHGGVSNACNVTAAYFGMFHLSWEGATAGARLKDWLDPSNTNPTTQNGYIQPLNPVSITGKVQCWWGVNMKGTRVAISGGIADTVTTDTLGVFKFNNLTSGLSYTVTPVSPNDPLNGVTTSDLVLISRHILVLEPFSSPWQLIAGDANASKSLSTFDIVEARKLIIGINESFPQSPSWLFFPASTVFQDPGNPFAAPLPTGSITLNQIQQSETNINFISVKVGDVNLSAFPGQ